MLSPFQEHVARLFLGLPEAASFALAGGAALVFRSVVPRTTQDLDFFGPLRGEVTPVAERFKKRLQDDGLEFRVISASPSFVRLTVRNASGEEILVDIGQDYRLRAPERMEIGLVLSSEELAADKLLALFGRAEARDFVDVFYLARTFDIESITRWAREKDPGFDPYVLAVAIGRLERLPPREFDVDAATYEELVAFFRRLRGSLLGEVIG